MKLPIEIREDCDECKAHIKELENAIMKTRGSYDWTLTLKLNSDWIGRSEFHLDDVELKPRRKNSELS